MIDVIAEQSPLGGLERWLGDPAIDEVIVNGGSDVWIERSGTLLRVATMSATAVATAIEHILRPIGRRLDRSNPIVDARLPDGSRVCAVIEPIAVDGPCLTIRRFAMRPLPLSAFAAPEVVGLLQSIVATRCNLLVSGATSSGKTTLLNALAALVPTTERIITLEDTAELRLSHPH
ncbi:MAG: CpaF family protein, partial [Ilumatobacteraceae bacterium]|nr:CpaF family protein [Ilumatobacteraceae bacterium]